MISKSSEQFFIWLPDISVRLVRLGRKDRSILRPDSENSANSG